MISKYLNSFISDKIGNTNLTNDFLDLLQYYNLTYEDGLKIQKSAFDVLDHVNDSDDCLIWKFRLVSTIKLNFSLIYENKSYYKFDDYAFKQYFCKVPFSDFIRMKSYLSSYFENNADVEEFTNKFNDKNYTKYFDTLLFYLEYSKISKIRNIDDLLNKFGDSLDLTLSYTLDEATDFLIENTSKEYIDYIKSFKDMEDYALKMLLTNSVKSINKLFLKIYIILINYTMIVINQNFIIIPILMMN